MKVPYTKVVIESAGVKSSKKVSTIDTGEYLAKRQQIMAEINADKVNIDWSCFKKTEAEKIELKKRKKAYKESLKN